MQAKLEKQPKLTKKERRALAEATSSKTPTAPAKTEKKLTKKERKALMVISFSKFTCLITTA